MERTECHACFGGRQEVWRHASAALGCAMKFGVYVPPAALRGQRCPVLYWLSGLSCTEQNFITKAGAQQHAARHGLILVAPDTSPRGEDVPDDPAYDLGQGAGFYLNAIRPPWAAHFRMEDYVVHELPALVERHFETGIERGIFGHSMGGHGALTLALRHPGRYASVSAFAPIVAPSRAPWGRKAFAAYLGEDPALWAAHDAVALLALASAPLAPPATDREPLAPLVDQGQADEFLGEQLMPERLREACARVGQPLNLRLHPGYDHSYYFIASFIGEHIAHHARALNSGPDRGDTAVAGSPS